MISSGALLIPLAVTRTMLGISMLEHLRLQHSEDFAMNR